MGLGDGFVGDLAAGHVEALLEMRVLGQRPAVALVGAGDGERFKACLELATAALGDTIQQLAAEKLRAVGRVL